MARIQAVQEKPATKTATKRERKPAAKSSHPATVDDYLAGARPDQRAALQKLRKTIKAAAPKATELISYGIVGYKHKGERLIYYGYWKDHLALYGFSSEWMRAHEDELERYDLRKSTLHFTPDKPLPQALVTKIVKGRLAEIDKANSA